jgi:NADPH-dependent stearoyl-CoA 9-desaturase
VTTEKGDPGTTTTESPLARLSDQQIEELGREFDAIHDEVYADLGDRDRRYITSMIEMHRRLAVMGRVFMLAARFKPAWIAGTAANSAAKILENMEIGHNVLHGQWDWMNDPQIHSSTWDWDTASTAEAWKHSHNYIHHTYTNILGKDKDLGYEIMRIDPHQDWHPVYLVQPFYNVLLMFLFEWGVALHDLDFEAIRKGEKSMEQVRKELKGIAGKARTQITKDYIAWPLVSAAATAGVQFAIALARPDGSRQARVRSRLRRIRHIRRSSRQDALAAAAKDALETARETFGSTVRANVVANIVRNVWAYAIIFCGHFPDQTYTFTPDEVEDETRGRWYVRQLVGAANIEGGGFFHVASGNLGYQVEHHLFPDMPSTRYAEIAPRVKEICQRYGLPYNSGPFMQQLGMVQRTILRLALPGGRARPKPGPFHSENGQAVAQGDGQPRVRRPEQGGSGSSGPEQADEGVRVSMPSQE